MVTAKSHLISLIIIVTTLILLPAAFLLAGCSSKNNSHHLHASSSTTRQRSLNEYATRVGDFLIKLDNTTNSIEIAHSSNPTNIIWKTCDNNEPFLRAAVGNATFQEARGHVEVKDKVLYETTSLTISNIQDNGNGIFLSGRLFNNVNSTNYEFNFTSMAGSPQHLRFSVSIITPTPPSLNNNTTNNTNTTATDDEAYNRIYLSHHTSPEETFHGFGVQYSFLDMKGREVTIVTSENGIGRAPLNTGVLEWVLDILNVQGDFDSTYAPSPYYLTNLKRSVMLENYQVSVFDLRDDDCVTMKLFSDSMIGRIIHGDTPLDIIESYTEYTGRMQPLPDWFHKGAIIGMQGGADRVLEVYNELLQRNTPMAAFWLQDWVGKRPTLLGMQLWWNWILDDVNDYPGWNNMVTTLGDVRVLTYINPFFVNVSMASQDEYPFRDQNLFQIAHDAGYLVRNAQGEPYLIPNTDFSAAMLDLTNPDAFTWMKEIIKTNMIGASQSSGWMADFGEALPFDAILASGESPETFHNRYPEEFARLNREAIEEAGRAGDIVFFSRSGFNKSPGISTLFWEGDQMVTWDEHDGLKSAVIGLLSGGLSGYSLNHNDIGGYFSVVFPGVANVTRSRELLFRWMEMNAFTAVFRTHEGLQPEVNVQLYTDNETFDQFARIAKVYAALAFYRTTLMQEAAGKGYPIVRHPFLHYPTDQNTYDLTFQWMLGSEFMVAPVTEEGQDSVNVYLPQGVWVHIWTLEEFQGGTWHVVNAPMGFPAVFFQKGSNVGAQFLQNLQDMNVELTPPTTTTSTTTTSTITTSTTTLPTRIPTTTMTAPTTSSPATTSPPDSVPATIPPPTMINDTSLAHVGPSGAFSLLLICLVCLKLIF